MADMTPSEAMEIVENPSDHTAQEVKDAKAVLRKYATVTERDRTPPRQRMTKPTPPPKGRKAQMMMGGMANGKKHMYATGGSVTENPGLRALKASGPKGREAYNKITGKDA
tara:strand:- start:375 stop:707 length:333 start_codon:yes stop_codon:yes gene_type:complete